MAVTTAISRLLPRPRLPLLCAGIAAGVTLLAALLGPSGDAPSHLFQTWLYRHGGFQLWNNLWYAGRYEFVSYSVFYYPLAAQIGELPVLRRLGRGAGRLLRGGLPARVGQRRARARPSPFACTTPFVSIVSGSYPFTAGAACVAAALLCAAAGHRLASSFAVVAALGFSPLAFAVLLALLAGLLLGHPQPDRPAPAATGSRSRRWSGSPCSPACSCSGPSRAAASTRTT